MPKRDVRLSAIGRGVMLLSDSVDGKDILDQLDTVSGGTWLWFNKKQLQIFIDDYLDTKS